MALFSRKKVDAEKPVEAIHALLDDYSIEITAKDVPSLTEAAPNIPQGTAVSVTFLPGENIDMRVAAAKAVRELGFVPVSHVSARRIESQAELEQFLGRLRDEAGVDRVFVVAGDPPQPIGPYEDALSIICTGLLDKYGIRRVGISGYPEGHPDISDEKLWQALKDKYAAVRDAGHETDITTQFAFDLVPVFKWVSQVREAGINARIRVGVPGPASVKTLLRFAARCGVGASASVMTKYGTSILNLLNTAGPETLLSEFATGLDRNVHGDVTVHFYPFGGVVKTAQWIQDFSGQEQ